MIVASRWNKKRDPKTHPKHFFSPSNYLPNAFYHPQTTFQIPLKHLSNIFYHPRSRSQMLIMILKTLPKYFLWPSKHIPNAFCHPWNTSQMLFVALNPNMHGIKNELWGMGGLQHRPNIWKYEKNDIFSIFLKLHFCWIKLGFLFIKLFNYHHIQYFT